ncbi:MAG: endonuclease III [Candidatus Woesearchaeota archaeon]|jgi:endonuclease-3|nr:endonuclease III [Candidatus Woesearchaeota archaeon]
MVKDVAKVIGILKKESKKFKKPFVSDWAEIVKSPYTTLISCLLSLRTKDDVTAKASLRLLKGNRTPEKVLKLSVKKIEKLIYPVGFYRTKARRIKEISKVLIDKYKSKVPKDFDELMKLKGVGKKTAAITMVYGHQKADFIPVDVHVHVIANRLNWVKTKTPDETMDDLMKVVPKRYWYDLNDLFVQFGQNVCVTISPKCSICPINELCPKVNVTNRR